VQRRALVLIHGAKDRILSAGKAWHGVSVMVSMTPVHAAAAALDAPSPARRRAWQVVTRLPAGNAGPITGLVCQLLLLGALAETVGLSGAGWIVGVTCGAILNGALAYGLFRYHYDRLAPADWVTLARATFAVGVAALTVDSFHRHTSVAMLVSLSAVALVLDSVDGWVARRTKSTETLGALLDGEVDAFLILVLSVYVARLAGVWVLAIGVARYAFLAAGWVLPWMRAELPPRHWRKWVTAAQGIVLTIAAADVLPPPVAQAALLGALVLLAESFGRDVWWLRANRQSDLPVATRLKRGPLRTAIGVVLTVLAGVLVWAALVAPDQPQALTPAAFMRVPLEGLVLIALAIILPTTARRVLAAVLGPALALLVILKILDIAFFKAFTRPFDLIGDAGNAGVGIETLRAAIGRTEANLIVYGGLAVAIALLVFMTLAAFRLTRVAADHRRSSLRALAVLGGVWLLCSALGAQFISHTPIASTSAAGFVVHEAHTVQADIHDGGVFAGQIKHDRFRNTPGDQLLTALRGKDVLLTFVESYGQVTVQGSSFSPAVDALLDRGTSQLKTAGFSARSAFLTSPTFGGVSWLAHSSLQAGVWANSQRRYNQLVSTDRFTLSDAFKRAGWRTVNDAPADDRGWEEGTSFYHYDQLYDRRDVGYHGPGYTYAPMPDQYMFSALQRLELAKTNRPPLFAEVDTVSSHMPWNRIPEMVPWTQVGDGSIFNRTPTHHWTGAFWSDPTRVKAAYTQAIEYSLNTLISFVQHYGKKNLVLIVVGDEQPLPNVSGQGANYDVPISIISHDPAVQKQIAGWGWQDGLRPAPQAPVWRMSAFRDRFLAAFGSGQ
jgi:phosphatidylglycerophosphate synthase